MVLALGSMGVIAGANEMTVAQDTEIAQDVEGRIADEIEMK